MPPRPHTLSTPVVPHRRTGAKATDATNPLAGYDAFVAELKTRIAAARVSVARRVNAELVNLYWDIGAAIADRQTHHGWGEAVVARLARDLQFAFLGARGFSAQNLWRMLQLHSTFTAPEFLAQAERVLLRESEKISQGVRESSPGVPASRPSRKLSQAVRVLVSSVPWGHHANVLTCVTDPSALLYYLQATARFGWSRAVLLNQIKARAYERTLAAGKTHNFPATLPAAFAEQAEEALKSSYSLEFLGIYREVKERELENHLIAEVQRFILELGYGFCFIGRQHRLVLGEKEYFVDLLFYHRFLKALVAIDLKVGGFTPEHAGNMDFYLNLLNDRERAPEDRPSIGIILCAEKDGLEVEFALKTKANPIGVAEYELQRSLPAELRGKLPTVRQLTAALRLK